MKNKVLTFTDKLLLAPLWVLTLLPLWVLYRIAGFVFIILYHIAGYRRKVVDENLEYAFPHKSQDERMQIARDFFRHLCDYFIESIYILHLSKRQARKRYTFTNSELINQLYDKGQSFILATSHHGNWEWAISFSMFFKHALLGVYKPLSNKTFDRLFIQLRSRFGGVPIPMKHTLRAIMQYTRNKEAFALYMVSDQRPGMEDLNFWMPFMNRETPVITGMDKLARRFNLPVVFCNVHQKKQGYYEVMFEFISNNPSKEKEYAIAEKYIKAVERLVNQQPQLYLWSHKRWKYSPEQFKPDFST